jgi:hypothetical protein
LWSQRRRRFADRTRRESRERGFCKLLLDAAEEDVAFAASVADILPQPVATVVVRTAPSPTGTPGS